MKEVHINFIGTSFILTLFVNTAPLPKNNPPPHPPLNFQEIYPLPSTQTAFILKLSVRKEKEKQNQFKMKLTFFFFKGFIYLETFFDRFYVGLHIESIKKQRKYFKYWS